MSRAYEVHVRGELDADVVRDLEAMGAVVGPTETLLVGDVRDQPALYGLLLRLQHHGLAVVEVRVVGAPRGSTRGDHAGPAPEDADPAPEEG